MTANNVKKFEITYSPLSEYYDCSNLIQYNTVSIDGVICKNIVYRSYFPHNVFKNPSYEYEIYGFDCCDEEYDKKLKVFSRFAKLYDSEVIENENIIFYLPDTTEGKVLTKIEEKLKTLFK